MSVRNLFLVLLFLSFISCSAPSEQPLTGDDKTDIQANYWLYQINMHDYFIHFDKYDTGWTGEVENSTQQYSSSFPHKEFIYDIDTIAKTIAIMYDETGEEVTWNYHLEFDNKRILYLDDKPYIDAKDEIGSFASREQEQNQQLQNSIKSLQQ